MMSRIERPRLKGFRVDAEIAILCDPSFFRFGTSMNDWKPKEESGVIKCPLLRDECKS